MLYLVRSRHVPANREHACAHPWCEQIAYHPHRRRCVWALEPTHHVLAQAKQRTTAGDKGLARETLSQNETGLLQETEEDRRRWPLPACPSTAAAHHGIRVPPTQLLLRGVRLLSPRCLAGAAL